MAEEQSQGSTPGTNNQYQKGLIKDLTDTVMPAGTYTHARNGTPILPDGNTGLCIHTETANIAEVVVPYTLIGRINLVGDQWILFSTNNTYSEIGLYVETQGTYTTMLNDQVTVTTIDPATGTFYPGLNFSTSNLIIGAARRNFDCGFDVYWSDGRRNPDRMLDTAYLYPNPWIQSCTTSAACITCVNTNIIDANAIRLAPQFSVPCLQLSKSGNSGLLLNGSYQVCLRFAINTIACTDFVALSNVMGIFAHGDQAGALTLQISGIDAETTIIFPEIEIVVVSMVKFQVQAKRLGIYDSNLTTIHIDNLNAELVNIDLKLLPLSNPVIDSSDAIYSISNYLVRVGTSEKPEFNYQPLANQIQAHWACIEYPDDYYHKGCNNGYPMNVSYLRGERYSTYIGWVYTTGDKSASYHIPGLPVGTAATIVPGGGTTADGGVILATGRFTGYSSTELYPDNEPLIWDTLCGLPVRHHQFPDQTDSVVLSHFWNYGTAANPSMTIRVMGMFFTNIAAPVDNNGNVIPNIQGYEILRDVRGGNEHILAKGMINNMRTYTDSSGTQGLFQNYPYNDLNPDYFLNANVGGIDQGHAGEGSLGQTPLTGYRNDILSFHSPDTVFQQPFIGSGQLQLLMGLGGQSHGQFQVPYKHPEFKVLTDLDTVIANLVGILATLGSIAGAAGGLNYTLAGTEDLPMTNPLGLDISPPDGPYGSIGTAVYALQVAYNIALAIVLGVIEFKVVAQQITNIIKGIVPPRQYAAQYNSSGWYNVPLTAVGSSGVTYGVADYQYIKGQVQSFAGLTVNNIYRNNYVAIQLNAQIFPLIGDNSRYRISDISGGTNFNWLTTGTTVLGTNYGNLESYYGAYTVPQATQYGQVGSCKQVPICCMQPITPQSAPVVYSSGIMFGGDTYINRYTEKNPFFFFNDWLINVPPDFAYDYRNYINVPYPMYWLDNQNIYYDFFPTASHNRRLNGPVNASAFYVSQGYFYLFNNGIRDFYVESSVNVGYRDYGDLIQEQFYNPYGVTQDINQLFQSDIIKSPSEYRYDYSLSADKFFNQYLSWGQTLNRDYNPVLAYSCYNYYPRRLAYSLPQEEEIRKDNWKVFLPNNYKDMPTRVICIQDTNKTGALMLLQDQAPQMFTGTESISSSSGTDYTTGDGKLFEQSLQSVTNVDNSYQYGSCQNRLAIVNTPYGIFWASQSTGKVFQYIAGSPLQDITLKGLKYWFARYMPSQLLAQFPNYPLYDNPVAGVGMQCIYDSINEILYICKKDYKVKRGVSLANGQFYLCPPGTGYGGLDPVTGLPLCVACECNSCCPGIPLTLGDPNYFTDCSWTVSYHCPTQQFLSYHDWHPALNIPAKTHFLTTNVQQGTTNIGDTLWRHNNQVGNYCQFYSIQYPFELEYPACTGQTETTLQNIEMVMESYLYNTDQMDKYLNYNGFFDIAMVYNSEQNSGYLELNLRPWDNPYTAQAFPFTDAFGTQILYDRIENTWRFNQFTDLTANRGQFGLATLDMFSTDLNGYTFVLLGSYFNTAKLWNERKRIRGRYSRVYLRKNAPGNNSMSIWWGKTNNQISMR